MEEQPGCAEFQVIDLCVGLLIVAGSLAHVGQPHTPIYARYVHTRFESASAAACGLRASFPVRLAPFTSLFSAARTASEVAFQRMLLRQPAGSFVAIICGWRARRNSRDTVISSSPGFQCRLRAKQMLFRMMLRN